MFSFVFLPLFLDRMTASRAPTNAPVVTTTRYGPLYESDLQQLTKQRQTIRNFLERVAAQIQEKGGNAQEAMQMANGIGLDEESAVTSWLLSQRARELGIVVSNKSVGASLQTVMRGFAWSQPAKDAKDAQPQMREVRLDNLDLKRILSGLHIGATQFAEIWRTELMAQILFREFALSLGGIPPGQRWDYFQRFSRRATVEVLPVSVDSVVDHEKTPDQATLKAFFEKHKNQLPSPNSPEPGFRQPHQIAVEYLKADENKFVDRAAVTEKEISAYYDQFKDIYYREEPAKPVEEKLPAPAPSEQTKPSEKPQAGAPKPAAEAPSSKKTEKSPPAQPPKQQTPPKPSPESKPAAATPPAGKPAADKPATAKPAAGKPEQKPAAGSSSKPSPTGKATPDAKKSSGSTSRSVFHFAAFEAKDEAKPVSPSAKPAEPATKAAAKPESPASKPASAGGKSEPPAAKAAAKPAEATAKAKEPVAGKPKDAPAAPAAAAAPPPKYIPLAVVREKIRDLLAQRQANAKMQKTLVGLQDVLVEYHQQWVNWKVAETTRTTGAPVPPPERPDLRGLAKQHKLVYEEIQPVSAWDIKGADISSSNVTAGDPNAGGGTPFITYAFETLTEFRPARSQDTVGNGYLFWKTQDIAERVPSFDDPGVAEQVLKTWRRVQARPAALKKAEQLAEEARKAQQSLSRSFGTRPGFVVTKSEPFAWLTFGVIPARFAMQQSRAQISEVQGVEQPGEQFMRTVFQLSLGEIGVACNEPETIYYVIRAVDFTPPLDVLWNSFRDGADMQSIYRVALRDQQEAMRAWTTALKTSAGLKWERDPHRSGPE